MTIKMKPKFTSTSKTFHNLPVFRIDGNDVSFIIINDLRDQSMLFPTQVLDELIEQLTAFKKYNEDTKDDEEVS